MSGGVPELRVNEVLVNNVVVVEVVGGGGGGVVGVMLVMRLSCIRRMTALFNGRGGGV